MFLELKNTNFKSIANEIRFILDISLHPYCNDENFQEKKNTYNLNVLRNDLAVALIDIMGRARTFIFFFTF